MITISNVTGCARCGGDHESLLFKALAQPFAPIEASGVSWTHWAKCPTNGEPVLLRVVADDWMPTIDLIADVEVFHKKFGLTYSGRPRVLHPELSEFRRKFMQEELIEYTEAAALAEYWLHVQNKNQGIIDDATAERCAREIPHYLEKQLDALVDLVYVAIGTAEYHGFNFREAWRRVHVANMKKERAQRASDSKRGTTYDVIKPPGWEAPSHADLVAEHDHKVEP